MKGVFKNVLAVIISAAVAMILITFMEMGIAKIYPNPPGTDMYDAASASKAIAAMPLNAELLILLNYAIASFIAGIIATLISKRITKNPALVSGFILMLGGLLDSILLHIPLWFVATSIFTYMPFAYFGYLTSRKRAAIRTIN